MIVDNENELTVTKNIATNANLTKTALKVKKNIYTNPGICFLDNNA